MIFEYITPEQAVALKVSTPCPGLKAYQRMARNQGTCEVCDQPLWKLAGTGLCFTCTTGEADADGEYELL